MQSRLPTLLGAILIASAVAAAPALGWGERAVYGTPRGAVATCLRSAGDGRTVGMLGSLRQQAPLKELITFVDPPRRPPPALYDVFDVRPDALVPRTRLRLGSPAWCPELAAGGDTTLLAGAMWGKGLTQTVQAVVTDGDGVPHTTTLDSTRPLVGEDTNPIAVAVSPRGDALVVWTQARSVRKFVFRYRLLVSRRAPGGPFGPPQALSAWRRGADSATLPAAGYDAAGNATVVWLHPVPRRRGLWRWTGKVATAPPGEPLHIQQLTPHPIWLPETLSLAVAPDGRALLAHDGGDTVHVSERSSADATFQPVRIPRASGFGAQTPVVAVRSGGAGLVAWQSRSLGLASSGRVSLMTRPAGGDFAQPRVVHRPPPARRDSDSDFLPFSGPGNPPFDRENLQLRAALAGDERFSLVWTELRRSPFGDSPQGALALTGSLTGSLGQAELLSCPCRTVNGVAALTAAEGPAAIFTDNGSDGRFGAPEVALSAGRAHLLLSDSPAAQAVPRLTVRTPRSQVVRWGRPLRLRVHCSAACDLRGTVAPRRGRVRAFAARSLQHAGWAELRLFPSYTGHALPRNARRVRVAVRAYAPGGSRFALRKLSVRARRAPLHPLPRPRNVRVRRAGRALIVSWRYPRAPANVLFVAVARTHRRGPEYLDLLSPLTKYVPHDARGRYRVVLRPRAHQRVRKVVVSVFQVAPEREKTVRLPAPPR